MDSNPVPEPLAKNPRHWSLAHILLPLAGILSLLPQVPSAVGLLLGMALALSIGNPYLQQTRSWTHRLLALSVVGLGAGMDLHVVGKVGLQGIGYTLVGISLSLTLGLWLAKRLHIAGNTGLLIAVGTAICGGSAIAAVAPAVGAKPHEVTVSLGTVFLLNAAALILFPLIGHHFALSQQQFGLWSALAIHDTSSVVGATLHYGPDALRIGTTVKLARALWIVPVAFAIGLIHSKKGGAVSDERPATKRPWFILGFLAMAALVTWIPSLQGVGHYVEGGAKRALVLTLFLIGSNLTRATIRSVGIKPLVQGSVLWMVVASATLAAILAGWIQVQQSQSVLVNPATSASPAAVSAASRTSPAAANSTAKSASMLEIPGGVFEMGCKGCKLADALPLHMVQISAFAMDDTPVTNVQFAGFVGATGYLTIAEHQPDPKDYPGIPADQLLPGSAVFSPPESLATLANAIDWWKYVPGASWAHPEGPGSNLSSRADHPAVHIAYPDAEAYCRWIGKRLPTEAEYEYAARGGLVGKQYAWGDELKPGGKWVANLWQGTFPIHNAAADGYVGTSPVKAFPPNGYGLYDVAGNVWQWVSDWYRPDTYDLAAAEGVAHDPKGPATSLDPGEPGVAKRVQRGGSYLCSDQYCTRYLVGSRGKGAVDSAGTNIGFRCVKSR